VIVTALASGIAGAVIPSAGGVIHGCYTVKKGEESDSKKGDEGDTGKVGALRVIDTDQGRTCAKHEMALDWNQTGPKGDKGDPGAPGRDGRDGTSATVGPEAPGANCAAGGVKITAANGVAYVCNALPPDPGPD
jgi:hypothetical protein